MMKKENDLGNIEYKTKLINKDNKKIEQIATQMRFRLNESPKKETIYFLGVKDKGEIVGVSDDEYKDSLETILKAAEINNYSVKELEKKYISDGIYMYKFIIREKNSSYTTIKICTLGNVDAGKSSLLSVLTKGNLDNGKGLARLSVFNYPHEVKTGRTSSISHQILGYDDNNKIINYDDNKNNDKKDVKSWTEIVTKSSKVIYFVDLAGHEQYWKTTIQGITSSFTDLCFILISGNNGINRITLEHIYLCLLLNIPFCIIITKIDLCENRKNVLDETINKIKKILKFPSINKIPYKVNNLDDCSLCATNIYSDSVVPLFYISNVTGQGLSYLKHFMSFLEKNPINVSTTPNVEYHIENCARVVVLVGIIAAVC